MEYLSMEDKRKELYMQDPEVESLGQVLQRLIEELHDQNQENLAEREQLNTMLEKYEELYSQYELMKEENDLLKA